MHRLVWLGDVRTGYRCTMSDATSSDPKIPGEDDNDPEVQSTPAGLTQELEDEIEETDADVGPDADHDA